MKKLIIYLLLSVLFINFSYSQTVKTLDGNFTLSKKIFILSYEDNNNLLLNKVTIQIEQLDFHSAGKTIKLSATNLETLENIQLGRYSSESLKIRRITKTNEDGSKSYYYICSDNNFSYFILAEVSIGFMWEKASEYIDTDAFIGEYDNLVSEFGNTVWIMFIKTEEID